MYIRYGTKSDQGRVRTSNEDSYAANARHKLFLVADGMGGHAAGEIASQIAVSTVEEYVVQRLASELRPEDVIRYAAQEANARVFETQRQRPELAGMGSTLTILSFHNNTFYVAHVGDSRAYLLREGTLDQITRDHSLVWHLLESGVLRKDELSSHPQKNLITRSIGPHPYVEVDVERGEAREGDVFLLCSDGLADVVKDDEISGILSDNRITPQEMCDSLVKAAMHGGAPDNVTVIVVRLESGELEEEDTGKFLVK